MFTHREACYLFPWSPGSPQTRRAAPRAALGLQVGSAPVAAPTARMQRRGWQCPGWPVLLSRRARWRPVPCQPRIRCAGRTVEPSEIS